MIAWFLIAQIAIATAAGVLCVILGLMGRKPTDLTMGATALVWLLLLAQLVVSVLAPVFGNRATGSLLEFYVYLISAVLLPVGTGFWALIERTRWSTVILGAACLSVAIMLYRMGQIWFVQGA
ncbi:hypothetical protein [Homoserinimonas sp. OAct 916]|uniref:hypothetical protein n=1 Tax=Homoserinimonas sp. OAct 916 TaxID=2211450 RepID=UPI000DBE5E3D|nr:hypothetical protein [Homoserinimonas sp. OAct 916]